ncbi:MAG: 16S rRNA (adenine(1518)-N(6)/adenine(1519)-N(6))-dimethyltransferase RsmA [Candidatus Latescibacterota bacterium]
MTEREGRQRNKKRFGQHFLTNGTIADRIVEAADIGAEDTVLEIGPGKGVLTSRLLDCTKQVTCVEIDRDLTGKLREQFAGKSGFRLIEGDILAINMKEVFHDTPGRIKVVSNLPYNISTPVIDLLIRNRTLISFAVLMTQKEVAARLLASPGIKDYGLTTINLGLCARINKIMDVKPGAFDPPPKVMSSVVAVTFSPEHFFPLRDERMFFEMTGAAFRQRRKMVRNTLIPYIVSQGISEEESRQILENSGIRSDLRPENLSVQDYVGLTNALFEALLEK